MSNQCKLIGHVLGLNIWGNPMAYDVSPYLLVPRRDLPTACKQTHHAKDLLTSPCAACALSDMCRSAMRKEGEAVPRLPQLVQAETGRAAIMFR